MRAPAHHFARPDAGTVRLFSAADETIDLPAGGFTSGLLTIDWSARAGDTVMDVTLSEGFGSGAGFVGNAYTPPDGAFAQFAANATQSRRVHLRGETLRVVLAFGGAAGQGTSRVDLAKKHGTV